LAEGFTATRPAAAIRDLAMDMLPDLEERAALLRPSAVDGDPRLSYLRPADSQPSQVLSSQLLRAIDHTAARSRRLSAAIKQGVHGTANAESDSEASAYIQNSTS